MSGIEERYSIWGMDKLVYGPVDRETLLRWTKDGRVTSETWVHDKQIDFWLQGEKIDFIKPELAQNKDETIRLYTLLMAKYPKKATKKIMTALKVRNSLLMYLLAQELD